MSEQSQPRQILRRRDAAEILGFSESQVLKFERQGLLTPIRPVPGLRSVRYDAEQVYALAKRWIESGKQQEVCA
jgi:MerR HTH family regulatory protein